MNQEFYKNKYKLNKIKLYKITTRYKNKAKNKYKEEFIENYDNNLKKNWCIDLRKKGGFYKVYSNIINRISRTAKENNIKQNATYTEIIGCSIEDLEAHITKQFTYGMSLDNYGKWKMGN